MEREPGSIAARMYAYRMRTGKSQRTCADAAGITTQTWYQVEKGYQKPKDLTIAKIERVIGSEVRQC